MHTEWAISGTQADVAPRAAVGNQSLAYFLAIRPLYRTLNGLGVQSEVALRLPSTISVALIIAAIGCCGFYARWPMEALLVGCLWPAIDWVQLFYATEARPYATVQLLTLLVWMTVIHIVHLTRHGNQPVSMRQMVIWCLLSTAAIACHATSVLSVAIAWSGIFGWLVLKSDIRSIAKWCLCAPVVASFFGLSIPTNQLWTQRASWASFAGGSSLDDLWQLYPQVPVVLACLVMLLAVTLLHRWLRRSEYRTSSSPDLLIWTLAFVGPILAVWLLTRWEIAPLMHRRYAVASLAPLALVSASLTCRFPNKMTRWLAFALLVGGLLAQQNTVAELRKGRLTPWQRLEGWRQTSSYINENCESSDEVWCASQLIEGNDAPLPIDEQLNQYLGYPLRGIYAPTKIAQSQVHGLVNDPQRWADQIFGPRESPQREAKTIWIVYRGIAQDLNRRIAVVSSKPQTANFRIKITVPAHSFGTVSVAQIRFELLRN